MPLFNIASRTAAFLLTLPTPTSVTMNSNSNSSLFTLENFSLVAVTTTVCSSAWILLTALFA